MAADQTWTVRYNYGDESPASDFDTRTQQEFCEDETDGWIYTWIAQHNAETPSDLELVSSDRKRVIRLLSHEEDRWLVLVDDDPIGRECGSLAEAFEVAD